MDNQYHINGNADYEENEELENDLILMNLHKRLAEMKKNRKKAEQDADLLGNRLKLLQGEEDKTLKKIEVTRIKTQEKIANMQRSEEQLRQKLEMKEKQEIEIELKKEQNTKMREELKSSIQQKREEKMMQILEEANLLKEQKKNNEDMLKYIKIEEMNTNKSKTEYIKTQRIMMEEKKRALELEKKNRLKMEYESKMMEEEKLRLMAESKISSLEQEEVEILKRIRTTTQVHKSLSEEYQKLAGSSSK